MKLRAAVVALLVLSGPLSAAADPGDGASVPEPASGEGSPAVTVTPAGSQPSRRGPDEWFTGAVRIDMLFVPDAPSRVSAGLVTFEPGARTAWHAHPFGQSLVVTEGRGWVQEWGGPVQVIRPGDVVRIPPGRKHWHGATATTGMSHIAIQEQKDGRSAVWMEKVSDEQYRAGPGAE